jgi:2-polyprenyl-6-methoxyphenol hydroxylase-like FAD-dependent oxidoreductase
MRHRSVLISGGGIAGSTLAYWLSRTGFRPTVVERARGLRSSGSPVDVRGPAYAVAERMGILSQLHAAGTRTTKLSFVGDDGRQIAGMALPNGRGEVELPRADLATILHEAGRDDAEYLYDDAIADLREDADGVDVTLEGGAQRRFDLVIGADGLHSAVRRFAFGSEDRLVRHMGLYVATLPLDEPAGDPTQVLMHNSPGRALSVHPATGRPLAAFIFRSPAINGFDHRDTGQHKRLLHEAYAGGSWRTTELLDQVRAASDVFFDAVSKVTLPRWSAGRLAVVGDAASCVSLFGDGSTLAIAGAATLAQELAASPDDHAAAFARYESRHRKLVEPKQRNVALAAALLIPPTRWGIALRNAGMRLWSTTAGLRRRPQLAA